MVFGTRGIPDIQGGVETVCQELYPRIAAAGHSVTLICRAPYVKDKSLKEYKGVKLISLYAPKNKRFEAIIHTFLAVIKARLINPDVVHIHAVGPSLMVPFARLLGMKVITTNHGPDYDRKKWGALAKRMLKAGEWCGSKFSNRIISISSVITSNLQNKYHCGDRTDEIPNGVNPPGELPDAALIKSKGLRPQGYVVALGRFVPEKGFHDLIEAYKLIEPKPNFELVIAGDADHPDMYSENLKKMARGTPGVHLTGFIKGEELKAVTGYAALFVMPSYHEGLPIALLEAMSHRLDVLTSDIPACMIPELDPDDHFKMGDVKGLAHALKRKMRKHRHRIYNLSRYNWDTIAEDTIKVYEDVLKSKGSSTDTPNDTK